MSEPPFDPGLQPERALLAWRRSALALGVAGLVAVRLGTPVIGGAAFALGIVTTAVAAAAYLLAARRYRAEHLALVRTGRRRADGAAVLLLATAAALVGVFGLAFTLGLAVLR